jgi:Copper chaperone
MKKAELKIEGMSCGHCVMSLKKELNKVDGLLINDVQIGSAKVEFDENNVAIADIQNAVEEAGYVLKDTIIS